MTGVPQPTYPATADGVTQALTALGATASAVADTLAAGGFTGRPCASEDCPVAHYLTAVIPGATGVRVSGDEIEVVPALGARLYVVPPAGVAAFIDAFDLSPQRFPAQSDETA